MGMKVSHCQKVQVWNKDCGLTWLYWNWLQLMAGARRVNSMQAALCVEFYVVLRLPLGEWVDLTRVKRLKKIVRSTRKRHRFWRCSSSLISLSGGHGLSSAHGVSLEQLQDSWWTQPTSFPHVSNEQINIFLLLPW